VVGGLPKVIKICNPLLRYPRGSSKEVTNPLYFVIDVKALAAKFKARLEFTWEG